MIMPKIKFQILSPNTWLSSAPQSSRDTLSATDQRKQQELIQTQVRTCAVSSNQAHPRASSPGIETAAHQHPVVVDQ